jgi:hypothetical protein
MVDGAVAHPAATPEPRVRAFPSRWAAKGKPEESFAGEKALPS